MRLATIAYASGSAALVQAIDNTNMSIASGGTMTGDSAVFYAASYVVRESGSMFLFQLQVALCGESPKRGRGAGLGRLSSYFYYFSVRRRRLPLLRFDLSSNVGGAGVYGTDGVEQAIRNLPWPLAVVEVSPQSGGVLAISTLDGGTGFGLFVVDVFGQVRRFFFFFLSTSQQWRPAKLEAMPVRACVCVCHTSGSHSPTQPPPVFRPRFLVAIPGCRRHCSQWLRRGLLGVCP